MKRTILFFMVCLCTAGVVFAQAQNVSVTGNLTVAQGMIVVKSDGITYLLPGLNRFIGFIDSLKDGAQVKFEGSAMSQMPDSKTKMVSLSKLTIGGKEYDFEHARQQMRHPGDITHYQQIPQGPQGRRPQGKGQWGRGQQGCHCPPQKK